MKWAEKRPELIANATLYQLSYSPNELDLLAKPDFLAGPRGTIARVGQLIPQDGARGGVLPSGRSGERDRQTGRAHRFSDHAPMLREGFHPMVPGCRTSYPVNNETREKSDIR